MLEPVTVRDLVAGRVEEYALGDSYVDICIIYIYYNNLASMHRSYSTTK